MDLLGLAILVEGQENAPPVDRIVLECPVELLVGGEDKLALPALVVRVEVT